MRPDLEWQPIETAPKDGTEIMLYGRCEWNDYGSEEDPPEIALGYWADFGDDSCWRTRTFNPYEDNCHATHWMPLPEPPKVKL